jgi:hypothetical protein
VPAKLSRLEKKLPALVELGAALDLEARLQARGELLVAADADTRGVVDQLGVGLIGDCQVKAV